MSHCFLTVGNMKIWRKKIIFSFHYKKKIRIKITINMNLSLKKFTCSFSRKWYYFQLWAISFRRQPVKFMWGTCNHQINYNGWRFLCDGCTIYNNRVTRVEIKQKFISINLFDKNVNNEFSAFSHQWIAEGSDFSGTLFWFKV